MDYRIGYRRPRSAAGVARQKRRRARWAWGAAALATVALTVAALVGLIPAQQARKLSAAPLATAQEHRAVASARLVYPFSIVPGGVVSREEVAKAVASDKVVAGHYASFDVSRARAVALDKPRWVHVSYRMGDKVYWTAKKVRLAAGETVVTDGAHEIRGRCGNRISDAPRSPVSAHEPPPKELDEPTLVGGYDEISGRRPGDAPAPSVETPQPTAAPRASGGFIPWGPMGYLAPAPIVPRATLPPTELPLGGTIPPNDMPPESTLPPGDMPPAATIPPIELPPGATVPPGDMPPGSTIPPIDFPPGPTIPPGELPPGATLPPPQGEVPEPAALWLVGIGAAAMLATRRRGAAKRAKG